MPRLAHSIYVDQREHLRKVWYLSGDFSLLTPKEQWDLHKLYVVTQEMNDVELRLHRRLVKLADASLPQRAGRAYAKLHPRRVEADLLCCDGQGQRNHDSFGSEAGA